MMKTQSSLEDRVVEEVRGSRDELIALTKELISYDTTARAPGDPARDEAVLQRVLERRLLAIGAETDLWEADPPGAGNPLGIPADLNFVGRPQLAARIAGAGGGRSLLLNGHIDAVDPGPREEWTTDPFRGDVREGLLYGRGANDMKGGLASFVVALEALHRSDLRLRGDVVFCSNTDEESTGAGGWSCVRHGVAADAGLCAEPSDFDAWTACRGLSVATLKVLGRAGHIDMPQASWREGGAVNAIEKMTPLLVSLERLRECWRERSDHQHSLLSPGGVLPTIVRGGEWESIYPASCEVFVCVHYLPGHVDRGGTGLRVREEVMEWVREAASSDPWLTEHEPEWTWTSDFPPCELPTDHEITTTVLKAAADVGRQGRVAGMDSWHDAATFTLYADTPTVSFGPGDLHHAHCADEFVPVDDLVDHCAATALSVMRWCSV